jgi:hypothetical protein
MTKNSPTGQKDDQEKNGKADPKYTPKQANGSGHKGYGYNGFKTTAKMTPLI